MSIRDIGKTHPKIKDTSKTCERIDPKEIAKALGAEIVGKAPKTAFPVPPRINGDRAR